MNEYAPWGYAINTGRLTADGIDGGGSHAETFDEAMSAGRKWIGERATLTVKLGRIWLEADDGKTWVIIWPAPKPLFMFDDPAAEAMRRLDEIDKKMEHLNTPR